MADTPEIVQVAQTFVGSGVAQATPIVRLVEVKTGKVIERCAVDAREILASPHGEYLREDVYLSQQEAKAKPAAEKPKGGAKD